MIVLILKVSNASFGRGNRDKRNSILVFNVMVSFLWRERSSIGNRSFKIHFSAILTLSTTNSYLRSKLLVKGDWFTIRMYH